MRKVLIVMLLTLLWGIPLPATSDSKGYSRSIRVEAELYRHRLWTAKSEFLVEAPPEKVWAVVLDQIDQWSEFVPRILFSRVVSPQKAELIVSSKTTSWKEVHKIVQGESLPLNERIQKSGQNEATYHKLLLMNLPWPIQNRWVLQKETDHFDPAKNAYNRRFVLEAGNLVVAEGYWRARPHPENPNWSLVYYENSYDPGFQVPELIFKPIVKKETRGVLEAVRKRAESQHEKPASPLQIRSQEGLRSKF
ncbi:MAG: hypothetical protein HYT76_02990 [Deltaproteobacteria bacterium]|nr:hypothetical protein [Deltaproteobacteria bacterium]